MKYTILFCSSIVQCFRIRFIMLSRGNFLPNYLPPRKPQKQFSFHFSLLDQRKVEKRKSRRSQTPHRPFCPHREVNGGFPPLLLRHFFFNSKAHLVAAKPLPRRPCRGCAGDIRGLFLTVEQAIGLCFWGGWEDINNRRLQSTPVLNTDKTEIISAQ